VWLAERGFDVDAVDVSRVACERLAAHAREHGLSIRTTQADLRGDGIALPRPPYDVVVCTFFLERALLPALASALAPGGLLLAETFTTAQAGRDRGPSTERMLLRPGELRAAFAGLELVAQRERDDGDMATAAVVARRVA
jgi:tellurite methyltransferase